MTPTLGGVNSMKQRSKKQRCRYDVTLITTVGLLTMLFGGAAISEERSKTSKDIGSLIAGGEVDLSFRYRYEYVDQDGTSDKAKASVVRSRLSLQSGSYRNFDFFVEVDDVREWLNRAVDRRAG